MRVVIVAFGSHGDVLPFLAIGEALRRRGHRVSLVAPPSFEPLALRAKLDFRALGEPADYEAVNADPRLWDAKSGARIMFGLAVHLARSAYALIAAEHDEARTRGEPFVAVASTLSFGPRLAQERLGARLATVHLSPFLMRSRHAPPVLPGLDLPSWLPARARHAIQRAVDRFLIDPERLPQLNALRGELGLAPIGRLTDWLPSPEALVLMAPFWFAPPQPDWPRQTVQAGFPRGDRFGEAPELSEAVLAFLRAGPPPVAITYGSSMRHGRDVFAAAVEACTRIGRRALLVTPRSEQIPSALPASVLHLPYAPFSRLLPLCAGLVHHGGIGTAAEALAAGVPQLVVPNAFDQFDNAARIACLGVGARLDRRHVTPARVAAMLGGLLNDAGVATACARNRLRMAEEDGIEAACDAIETAATGRDASTGASLAGGVQANTSTA